mmetsp:Transcript_27141/g.39744  ORF Transcript_27141/g.39744 Transcript_27141/m.39744 type:complete len:148 (-) Transcript_27141:145-588(-)
MKHSSVVVAVLVVSMMLTLPRMVVSQYLLFEDWAEDAVYNAFYYCPELNEERVIRHLMKAFKSCVMDIDLRICSALASDEYPGPGDVELELFGCFVQRMELPCIKDNLPHETEMAFTRCYEECWKELGAAEWTAPPTPAEDGMGGFI